MWDGVGFMKLLRMSGLMNDVAIKSYCSLDMVLAVYH